jgi:four helix bundle protein
MSPRAEAGLGHSYRDLLAWQKAKALAVNVSRQTEPFPKPEIYGLRAQIRGAAVSVPSNIAEGQGRQTRGEFLQFLGHSRGSLLELQTQLDIARDLAYITPEQHSRLESLASEVLALLNGLMASLRSRADAAGA